MPRIAPPAEIGRRLPHRIVTLPLPEPYQEFSIEAWINFPQSLMQGMASGDEARIMDALTQIVVSHDLVDFDGQPYPQASERAFWEAIPTDLAMVIMQAINDQVGKLPKANGAR
jgi:hypothetical protein